MKESELMGIPKAESASLNKKERVLTQAVLRAAEQLEISRRDLSKIIGTSEPTLSRMHQAQAVISLESKEGEAAVQFVRLFRSLDSLFGGESGLGSKWLKASNHHLGGVPLELAKKITGLLDVIGYLDAMRAKA